MGWGHIVAASCTAC